MAQQAPIDLSKQAYTADYELDLGCTWDPATHGDVRDYVEKELPHLLRAYDAEFLVRAAERSRLHAGR